MDHNRHLICIVVQVDKTVIQEEPRVAFLSIAVIHLLPSWDVITCLDDESLSLVAVIPSGLSWSLVVEHIRIWHETISLHSIDGNAENSARYHHSYLRVLLDGELLVVRNQTAD